MKANLYDSIVHERRPTTEQQKQETEVLKHAERVQYTNWRQNEISQKYFKMLRGKRNEILQELLDGYETLTETTLRCKLAQAKQLTQEIEGTYYDEGKPDQAIEGPSINKA